MWRWILLALLASVTLRAAAAKHVTVAQLEQALTSAGSAQKSDADIARQIASLELSEQLTETTLDRLRTPFAADPQTRLALQLLADQSAFLEPPASELPPTPAPDDSAQQRILQAARDYVTQTLPRLPNFLATRTINRYDDSPQTGTKGGWALRSGLHLVDTSSRETSVRDARDSQSPTTGSALWREQIGLIYGGEFGSTLGMVMADTVQGKIKWSHWESAGSKQIAVFSYSVPKSASHYEVIGSVQRQAAMDTPDTLKGVKAGSTSPAVRSNFGSSDSLAVLTTPGYHGSLSLDPESGTVLRITVEADSKGGAPFRRADILVRYSSVQIADKQFVCPVRSVALSIALVAPDANSYAPTIWLNETLFTNYRRFASTTHLLAGGATSEPKTDTSNAPTSATGSQTKQQLPIVTNENVGSASAVQPAPATTQSSAQQTPDAQQKSVIAETSEAEPKAATPGSAEKTSVAPPNAPPEVQPASLPASPIPLTPSSIVVNVNRVLVPVVVRDKQGRVIRDLKREDFQVFDDNKPRSISAFTVEKRAASETNAAVNPQAATPASSTAAPSPSSNAPKRVTVFLFDDMHLSYEDLKYVETAGEKAIATALAGEGMADVVSTSGKVNSGLTRDPAKLNAAIASLKPQTVLQPNQADCPNIDYYRADLIENKHDPDALEDGVLQLYICSPGVPQDTAQRMVETAARRTLEAGQIDIQSTYAVIGELVRRMGSLPGQRTLIFVSPGFLAITPEAIGAQANVIDRAIQSNVIIDTLDARGLYVTEDSASDNVGGRNSQATMQTPQVSPTDNIGGRNTPDPMRTTEYRRRAMLASEAPLEALADNTAGSYFHHNNDLDAGLEGLAEGPEAVYVLELPLGDVKADGAYHRLRVKVDRDGAQVRARHGYYAPPPLRNNK